MSKIPPRDWPKYDPTHKCGACGSTETEDSIVEVHIGHNGATHFATRKEGRSIQRICTNCDLFRHERPLDFDFKKWAEIWVLEDKIEIVQKRLAEARKAVE